MVTKIYVGNLPWSLNHDDLFRLFEAHGKVLRAQVLMDRESGRSRGFGFVEMESADDAWRAIAALNGLLQDHRPMIVNLANSRA